MTKKKKISRKQLLKEPDEFISTTGRLIQAFQARRIQIFYAAGALLLLLLIFMGARHYMNVRENRAFSKLDQISARYDRLEQEQGLEMAFDSVAPDFASLLDHYPRNNGGKVARMVFAGICYSAGAFDRAITLYRRALRDYDSEPYYRKLVVSSLGHAYAAKADRVSAVTYFQTIASQSGAFLRDEALFHLGHYHAAAGDREKSRERFEDLVSEYPSSMYVEMVKEKLSG